jgi:hypothetical protein
MSSPIICDNCDDVNRKITYVINTITTQVETPYYNYNGDSVTSSCVVTGITYTCTCGNSWTVENPPK